MATLEAKPTSTPTLEEKQRSGKMKNRESGFGIGVFGTARFGGGTGYETTKEAKPAGSATLEAKIAGSATLEGKIAETSTKEPKT